MISKKTTKTSTFFNYQSDPDFHWIDQLKKELPKAVIYLVGGQVRDRLLDRPSKDFDFVIAKVSPTHLEKTLQTLGDVDLVGKSFGVYIFRPKNSTLEEPIEIALPRIDKSFHTGGYKDFQIETNPDLPIKDDLARRDFTVNAMAYDLNAAEIVDPFDGQKDLQKKIIRAVGEAEIRFKEDYTRMLRAVRFAAQLDFDIEKHTLEAIRRFAPHIKEMAAERLQTELNKILLSKNVEKGFLAMQEAGLLREIIPELEEGVAVHQGKSHIFPVFNHLIKAADNASKKGYDLHIILSALLHDVAKPRTKGGDPVSPTFYNHEYLGEKMTKTLLNRLKYPKETVTKVSHLVRNHMFYYNTGEVSDAGIRRLIAKVKPENIEDLLRVRMADRLGMGRPKAKPYKLVDMERRMRLLQTQPVSVQMLAIDGHDIMETLKIQPSIRIKHLQNALLNEVLEKPEMNKKDVLLERLTELHKLTDQELIERSPDYQEVEAERRKKVLSGFKGVD